jgi:hypothetical protein
MKLGGSGRMTEHFPSKPKGNLSLLGLNYGGVEISFFLQWLGDKIMPPHVPTQADFDRLNEMAKRMAKG